MSPPPPQIDEDEELDTFPSPSSPLKSLSNAASSSNFALGNKARTGGRDTQFYQVLNVSETWHRNHTLSKKEDQKLLFTKELLAENLEGWGYVAVEIYDIKTLIDIKFRVRCKVTDLVSSVKRSIAELVEVKNPDTLGLWVEGKRVSEDEEIKDAIRRRSTHNWPKPYLGLVWVCPA
mmetsp:Transcript_8797/g.15977  ORF Transcript_8797/g.15977 Transcript_8797/m.15977 type:complete len:177 (+) Transcript_8797:169-699(+)